MFDQDCYLVRAMLIAVDMANAREEIETNKMIAKAGGKH
jgi:hypothetical protein